MGRHTWNAAPMGAASMERCTHGGGIYGTQHPWGRHPWNAAPMGAAPMGAAPMEAAPMERGTHGGGTHETFATWKSFECQVSYIFLHGITDNANTHPCSHMPCELITDLRPSSGRPVQPHHLSPPTRRH